MEIVVGGRKCFMYWRYDHQEVNTCVGVEYRDTTSCCFKFPSEVEGEDSLILSATVIRNPKDKDEKEIARKESLKKLFSKLEVSKEDRKAIWEIYFNRGISNTGSRLQEMISRIFGPHARIEEIGVMSNDGRIVLKNSPKTEEEKEDDDDEVDY